MYKFSLVFSDDNIKPSIWGNLYRNIEVSVTFNLDFIPINFNLGIMNYIVPLLYTSHIIKHSDLISCFYSYNMLNRLNTSFNNTKCISNFEDFNFVGQTCLHPFSEIILSLLANRVFRIFLLTVIAFFMQQVSTLVCNGYVNKWFNTIFHIIYKWDKCKINNNRRFFTHNFWFINYHSVITSRTNWIRNSIYNLSCKKMYDSILLSVYNNIKSFIGNSCIYSFTFVKILSNHINNMYLAVKLNAVVFSGLSLNVIYASLSVLYVFAGWLLDFLSYTWMLAGRGMNYSNIFTLAFWFKHFFYAVLYIAWVIIGVISTNGIYFLIFNHIVSIKIFDVIIIVVGSIISYISSNLWYFYGKATVAKQLSIKEFILSILFLSPANRGNTSTLFRQLIELFYHYTFNSLYFNNYASFRRSLLEWISFLSMVFSTYGTWDLYTTYVFHYLSPVFHLIIWIIASSFSGYLLIFLEETRPRYGNLIYGLGYLCFWTSTCFFSNTIVVTYFNYYNAIKGLFYFIPLNFFLAFVYSVPLYRNSVVLNIVSRLVHLFFLILLLNITLISAGLIWYLISPA